MLIQLMKKNIKRNKSITGILLVFLFLASILITSGLTIVVTLMQAINNFAVEADAPDYVQMHSAEMDEGQIREWINNIQFDHRYQTVEMITVEGTSIYIGDNPKSEVNSVMDISFVMQNREFDFLLDMDNQIAYPAVGEIGVPVFYMLRDQLEIGDTITFKHNDATIKWTISHFIRDALMNPAVVHSKRFLINDKDYQLIANIVDNREYLIEFKANNEHDLDMLIQSYQSAALPQQGPAIDRQAFQVLNSVTEGLVAVVLLVISFLLILIALVCIRLTISATLEEDYFEIGVMKAIGVTPLQIKYIYIGKYLLISSAAGSTGFLIAKIMEPVITDRITSYFGSVASNGWIVTASSFGVLLMIMIVFIFCYRTLGKIENIRAVTAIQHGRTKQLKKNHSLFSMEKRIQLPLSFIMAIKDFFHQFKMILFYILVIITSTFLIAVPILLYQTIKSPYFMSYMGIGQGDIRIDLPASTDDAEDFQNILQYLQGDKEVRGYASLATYSFQSPTPEGEVEKIRVESGDISRFSLSFIEGRAPKKESEIALSYLYSKDFNKKVGDEFLLFDNGTSIRMTITGIYQDITNGGRTAKAILVSQEQQPLHYVINLHVKGDIQSKLREYRSVFQSAKITHLEGYKQETLGDTINLIKIMGWVAFALAVIISILIVSLFIKLVLARKREETMILQSIGFSRSYLQKYYFYFFSVLSIVATLLGMMIAVTIGESIVSYIWSFFGASNISFEQEAIQLVIYPVLFLILSIIVTIWLGLETLKSFSDKEWRG